MRFMRWSRRIQAPQTYPSSIEHQDIPPYDIVKLFAELGRRWDERQPVETFTVFDDRGEPLIVFDTLGRSAIAAVAS